MLKIVTWNINGIRSSQQDLKTVFDSLDCDILCLQETKITRDMLDETTAFVEGYTSFYSFCRKRSGYSGVATYCRNSVTPFQAEEGITGTLNSCSEPINFSNKVRDNHTDDELKELDSEGRCVMTLHKLKDGEGLTTVVVINVYCPHGGDKEERTDFKLRFYAALELRCRDMLDQGYHVIVLGDLNVSHKLIDHCEPEDPANFPKHPSRLWMDRFLDASGNTKFTDSFRYLHPTAEKSFTCWNTKLSARVNNYGTRIDYILISPGLLPWLTECCLMTDVHGSDHCPVRAHLALEPVPSSRIPGLCTKHFKEFSGKQLKMSSFVCSKRSLLDQESSTAKSQPAKKAKVIVKQQSNLLQFFGQPNKKSPPVIPPETKDDLTEGSVIVPSELLLPISSTSSSSSAALWKDVFKGPPPAPLCSGHQEPCVLRTVKKKGPNFNRQFWACARAGGHSTDPNAQCNSFQWATKTKRS